jgi:hypothetical protein
VQSQQDKAADQMYGPGSHLATKSLLESALSKVVTARFPCIHYVDKAALGNRLTGEKQPALPGSGDFSRLAKIASAAGAGYLMVASVDGVGDKVNLNGVVLDTSTGAVLSRNSAVTGGGNAASASIQQFARKLVNGMGSGPQCPGKWKGLVTVLRTTNFEDDGKGTSSNSTGKLECRVLGIGSDAWCSVDSVGTLKGKGGTLVTKTEARDTPTSVTISVRGDKLDLTIGLIPVSVTHEGILPIAPTTGTTDVEKFTLPASSDPNAQSGSWEDSKLGSRIKTTVSWSLSRQR